MAELVRSKATLLQAKKGLKVRQGPKSGRQQQLLRLGALLSLHRCFGCHLRDMFTQKRLSAPELAAPGLCVPNGMVPTSELDTHP